MRTEPPRKNPDFVAYNAEIKEQLSTNRLVWRNSEHKRFAVIDSYITAVYSDHITHVSVSGITVTIADPEMYDDEVGQQRGGGIWPVKDVKLISENEAKGLRKNDLLH